MGDAYVVEVEASTNALLKLGVLAMSRGLTGSRYRSTRLGEHETADWDARTLAWTRPQAAANGPTFTTVAIASSEVRSDAEAVLVACQMVACTSGGMPTSARLISWPDERI